MKVICSLFLIQFAETGGKIGFYYKEHEILPPLPGRFQVFSSCMSKVSVRRLPVNWIV